MSNIKNITVFASQLDLKSTISYEFIPYLGVQLIAINVDENGRYVIENSLAYLTIYQIMKNDIKKIIEISDFDKLYIIAYKFKLKGEWSIYVSIYWICTFLKNLFYFSFQRNIC